MASRSRGAADWADAGPRETDAAADTIWLGDSLGEMALYFGHGAGGVARRQLCAVGRAEPDRSGRLSAARSCSGRTPSTSRRPREQAIRAGAAERRQRWQQRPAARSSSRSMRQRRRHGGARARVRAVASRRVEPDRSGHCATLVEPETRVNPAEHRSRLRTRSAGASNHLVRACNLHRPIAARRQRQPSIRPENPVLQIKKVAP